MEETIAIVGAGLSGLCLAQALRRMGLPFHVYETGSRSSTSGQGYRLTIDAVGLTALKACLPDDLYRLALATAGAPGGAFTLATPQRGIIDRREFPAPLDSDDEYAARQMDRGTLRQILMGQLDEHLSFDKKLVAIEEAGREAILRFADGTTAKANVVVGADGVHSAIREFVYPGTQPRSFGYSAIFGRSPLVAGGRSIIPEGFAKSGVLAHEPGGATLFFTSMHFLERPNLAAERLGPISLLPQSDYVMWSVVIRDDANPPTPFEPRANELLLSRAYSAIRNFHPDFRRIVEAWIPGDVFLTTVRSSEPPRDRRGERLTLIGDAIHAMPPFGAQGGNTALRDAQTLALCLSEERSDIPTALRRYEHSMLGYGFAAVADSILAAERMIAA